MTVGARRAGDPPVLVASNARRGGARLDARGSTLDEMVGSAWAWRRRHPDGLRRLTHDGQLRGSSGAGRARDAAGGRGAAPELADLARARPVVA